MTAALHMGAYAAQAAELTVLPNGMQVLVEEDARFPLVSMRLFVHAGSAYEKPDESGISHLLEHMVFKGTETRAPGEIARAIESAGGYLNAGTSFDQTVYVVDLPSEQWQTGLDVLKDMIFGMSLDPKELEQEKNVVLSELERNEDNPSRRLFKSIQPMVWPDGGYSRPVIGTRETIPAISRSDIISYLDRLYNPQSMLLVVCGNVTNEEIVSRCEELFSSIPNKGLTTPPEPWEVLETGPGFQIDIQQGPWKKVYMSLALPLPGFHAGSEPGLEVLGHLLGGDKTSRFYKKFKHEMNLVDEISVSSMLLERAGMLYVHAQLDPDRLDAFWEELLREMQGLSAELFSAEDLARAKLNIEDSLFQTKETLGGLASKLGYFQFYEGGVEAEERYLHQLRHVHFSELQALIETFIRPDKLCASLLLPAEVPLEEDLFKNKVDAVWPGKETAKPISGAEMVRADLETETFDIGQGRSLVLIPDETLPYTSLTIVWPGGDQLLSPDQEGLAALTARGLTRGTEKRTTVEIREFLADRAAHLASHAGRDQFSLSVKFPVRFSEDILELVKEIVQQPSWNAQEMERVKQEQISDIVEREDQPLGLLFRHVFPFLFKDHPYGYFHLGAGEQVATFTPDQMERFWEEQRNQPMVISVCGQFDRTRIFTLAKSLAKSDAHVVQDDMEPSWSSDKSAELHLAERNQTHLLVVFPVPGLKHPHASGLTLLRKVLTGQGGLLFRELRDKQGLGYTVTAMLWQAQKTGFIGFYIGTYPDKSDQALEGFRAIIDRLHAELLPEAELDRAKNLLQGGYYREHQSLGSRSSEAAELLSMGLPLEYNQKLITKTRDLSAKDMQSLARRYLIWDQSYVLQVAP